MHYHRIPHSSLEISQLGLGTMTFGEQNSEADAHAQLDYAVSQGINLIDVAEMYPVPPRPETQGLTETYVGNWLAKRGNREKLVIASTVSGPSRNNDAGIRPNQILDRFDPRRADEGKLPLALDSRPPSDALAETLMNEQRFRRLNAQQPEVAEQLWKDATADLQKRYDFLAQLAGKAEKSSTD